MYIQTFRNGTGPINVKPPVGRNLANRNHDIAVYFHKYILQQMVRHFSFTYFLPRPSRRKILRENSLTVRKKVTKKSYYFFSFFGRSRFTGEYILLNEPFFLPCFPNSTIPTSSFWDNFALRR